MNAVYVLQIPESWINLIEIDISQEQSRNSSKARTIITMTMTQRGMRGMTGFCITKIK